MDSRVATSERAAEPVSIPAGGATLHGALISPEEAASGVVVFAHGTGSGRDSPRNRAVAEALADAGLASLLVDLLSEDERRADAEAGEPRLDVWRLALRVLDACGWLARDGRTKGLGIGLFGASTGAAAALYAAEARPSRIKAVVSRGGRPDLAEEALPFVWAPTLMIVGGNDRPVIATNRRAMRMLRTCKRLEVVPGAGHLFEEPGALDRVAELTRGWLLEHLPPPGQRTTAPPRFPSGDHG